MQRTRAASPPANRRPGPDRTTIADVGRLAGVSPATVSRVVNDHPRVTPETRAIVHRAIDQLGYLPNRAARSLMTRRTESIGVVISEPASALFSDPFFGLLLRGISAGLAGPEMQLVLLMTPSRQEELRVEHYLRAGHVDGAIIVGPHASDPVPERLHRAGLPIVLNGRPLNDVDQSFVDADNRNGAAVAVTHLVDCGRRTIGTIHGTIDLASGRDRLDGYRDALREADLTPDSRLEIAGDYSPDLAATATASLLERRPDLDGLFCASDTMAASALRVIRESGRRVPEDVAVVGFDDAPVASTTSPALSTVRQPIEAMGTEMARLVLGLIEQTIDSPQQIVFPTKLIIRESSAAG